jgi:hypothetical protein
MQYLASARNHNVLKAYRSDRGFETPGGVVIFTLLSSFPAGTLLTPLVTTEEQASVAQKFSYI